MRTFDMTEFLQVLGTGGGIAGVILGFHLWKIVPELRAIWRAIDRGNRVRLLGIIAAPHVAPALKEEATVIIQEISDEEERSQKREIVPP